jgi:hypothetical protein
MPCGTRWRATRRTARSPSTVRSCASRPTTTRSSTCSTRTPARRTSPGWRPRTACTVRTASTRPAHRPDRGRPAGRPRRLPARRGPGRSPARTAPGRALPRGARRSVPQVVRHLPGAPDEPTRRSPTCTAAGCGSTTPPARCLPTASTCSGSAPPSACEGLTDAHPRGWCPARRGLRRPAALPAHPDRRHGAAAPAVARQSSAVTTAAGRWGRRRPRPWRRSTARRPTSWTRTTSVRAPALPRQLAAAFERSRRRRRLLRRQGLPVHGGRPVGRWRRGSASTSAPEASWPSPSGWFPGERIGFHGNNKSVAEIRHGTDLRGGPDRRRLLPGDRAASRWSPPSSGSSPGHGPRHRRRRGAHPRVHRHRPRGPEVRLQPRPAVRRSRRPRASSPPRRLRAARPAQPHRQPDLRHRRLRDGRAPPRRAARPHRRRTRSPLPEIDLGGGYGIAYTSQHTPLPASTLAGEMAGILEREFKAVGDGDLSTLPRVSIEPGRAIVGPSTFTLYEVGTVKPVELGGGHTRTYVSVDGGMSDNARPALYEADYSCTLANRRSEPGRCCRGSSDGTARAVTSSCSTSTCRPTSARRPHRRAGHGGLLPRPVQPVQPHSEAAGRRRPWRAVTRARAA